MNKPVDIFKKTFSISFLVIALFPLILKTYPFLFAIYTGDGLNNNRIALWALGTLHETLLVSSFALIIPWLLLSFYGEFFYTRSLNRQDIFNIFKNQYFKYSALILIPILSVICITDTPAHHLIESALIQDYL